MPQTESADKLQVAMIQDAARRRYALPATLHQAQKLAVMYTDFFVRPGSFENVLQKLTAYLGLNSAISLAQRTHPKLLDAPIGTWPVTMFKHRRMAKRLSSQAQYYQHIAQEHSRIIAKQGYANANMLLGFIRNLHPDLLTDAKAKGLITVGDQIIAPASIELQQAQIQAQKYPNWQDDLIDDDLASVIAFEKRTWEQLDHILCMSDFVKQGLINQGIDAARITLLPYPMDVSQYVMPDRSKRTGPITVGFTGAVNLRKGAPQFLQIAKQFDPQQVQFVMVGQNHLKPEKTAQYVDHVQMIGKVPRHEIQTWLEKFDIFFFPSTCEGSAGSVIEAMAMGLPTVTTANAGSQIQDGIDGRIIPCGDMNGYFQALTELIEAPDQRINMGLAARKRAMEYDMDWYQNALIHTLENFLHA